MRKIQLIIVLVIISVAARAQQTPLYGLYFMDPFLFNPAAAGLNGYSQLHLNHRQQWRGIQGAPVTSTLLLHLPVTYKASLGMMFMNDTRGPLTTNTGEFTFGYLVPFGDDHGLRFGLSGGAGWNSIDFNELGDLDDPAIAEALDNHFFVTGRFGVMYNYHKFQLGFVFPTLFKSDLLSDEQFEEIVLEPFQNYIVSASYRFNIGPSFAFEPWAVYKASEDGTQQWEGTGIFRIKDIFWLGGTYRKDNEYAAVAGFQISDVINMGYAYEPAGNKVDGYSNGSHELHLSVRLGKKKTKAEKTVPDAITPEEVEAAEKQLEEEKEPVSNWSNQEKEEEVVLAPVIEVYDEDPPITVKRGSHPLEIPSGHYVIAGAFSVFGNAEKYSDFLFKKGHPASFGFLTEKNLYYVWIYTGTDPDSTRRFRDYIRQNKLFGDAWYLLVEN